MNKRGLSVILATLAVALFAVAWRVTDAPDVNDSRPFDGVSESGLWAYDPDDFDELLPRDDDVFVAKVTEQLGSQYAEGSNRTQFSAEVIHVLKGDAKGTVTLSQLGGVVDGRCRIIDTAAPERCDPSEPVVLELGNLGQFTREPSGSSISDTNPLDEYLLKPGRTYLFIGGLNESLGWYTLGATPKAREDLGIDPALDLDAARAIVVEHTSVKLMEELVRTKTDVPPRDR